MNSCSLPDGSTAGPVTTVRVRGVVMVCPSSLTGVLAVLSSQRLPLTGAWPAPCAGHGVIAIPPVAPPGTWIGLPGVLVAVLIGVTPDPVVT